MQAAGAEAIMPWSVMPGSSRAHHTRAEMNWDVPIVGQTTLGSPNQSLLKKVEFWEKSIRTTSATAATALRAHCRLAGRVSWNGFAGNITMSDTLLWWIALGYDGRD